MEILRKIYYFLLDTVQTVLLLASIFVVIYIFLFRPFEVVGRSMYPNFQDGELTLTNIISLKYEGIKKGDVIVFVSPVDKDKNYIKRVIAQPGDSVYLRDGDVYINNTKLDESKYLKPEVKTPEGNFLKEGTIITVPEDEYFVLGDNRSASSDSRDWGFLKKNAIIGKSFIIYWPPNQFQLINNPY